MDPTRFIQSRFAIFEESAGLVQVESEPSEATTVFRRVSDLAMTVHEAGGSPAALVQMPPAARPAEAFFVAAVLLVLSARPEIWPPNAQARVFTLEAQFFEHPGADNRGVLCEWTANGEHRILALRSRLSAKDFFAP